MLANLVKLQCESVQQRTNEINDQIDAFYDSLENEVNAKLFVNEKFKLVEEQLASIITLTRETSDEAAFVQQSYRLNEKEAQIPKAAMTKLDAIEKRFDVFTTRIEQQASAYSSLQEELQQIVLELEEIGEERESFANRINNLRIDENSVQANIEELSRKLQNTHRKLHKPQPGSDHVTA